MTTFKITDKNHPLHGRSFPEHTPFTRYTATTAAVEYVPLLVGANVVKFFARCNLEAVDAQPIIEVTQEAIDALYTELYERHTVQAFDSGLLYDQPQPCTALAIWRPTIEVPITELGFWKPGSKGIPGVNLHMSNARIVLTLPDSVNDSRNVTVIPARAA